MDNKTTCLQFRKIEKNSSWKTDLFFHSQNKFSFIMISFLMAIVQIF